MILALHTYVDEYKKNVPFIISVSRSTEILYTLPMTQIEKVGQDTPKRVNLERLEAILSFFVYCRKEYCALLRLW